MSDLIDRDLEISSWEKANEIAPDERYPVDDIIESLRYAPSVDAVEVVRCKDCKFYHRGKTWHCDKVSHFENGINDMFYCAWGEKE